jgi:hypothetical protein
MGDRCSSTRAGNQKYVGECQAAATGGGLKADVHILVDKSGLVNRTGHAVPVRTQLLRNSGERHNDARNRGSVIRPHKYGQRASGNSKIGNRDGEETDTDRTRRFASCVVQAMDPLSACANEREGVPS